MLTIAPRGVTPGHRDALAEGGPPTVAGQLSARPAMNEPIDLAHQLAARGVPRRSFLKFCAAMAAALAMPPAFAHELARGLQSAARIPIVWLEGQDCAGNSEALLRAEKPTVAQLLLDTISLDYHHLIMAASGARTDENIAAAMRSANGYIAIVEGSIPLADGGIYCTIGGRTFAEMAREVCSKALGVIAVGSCAWDGGIPAARGGQTGAVGVGAWLGATKVKVINLPGCPMNPENLTALIVQYLATKTWSPLDNLGRPLFAYGDTVHSKCESLPHYRAKEFVRAWGDEGHRKGWCLYQMGCKGPSTDANCPTTKFNGGASWPVSSGHGCVGCTTPRFWDTMVPFYDVGGPKELPASTPVPYQTPVPNSTVRTAPGTPAGTPASPSSGGAGDAVGLIVGGGAAVAVTGAVGAAIVLRKRRMSRLRDAALRAGRGSDDGGAGGDGEGDAGGPV